MRILIWTLRDEAAWLGFWTAGMGIVICFVVGIYPVFSEVFESMMTTIPLVRLLMGRLAPELISNNLLDAFLSLELFAWFVILGSFYPLIFASNAIAGEIERGTMEPLLTQPISRSRVFLEKYAAIAIDLAALCTVSFVILVVVVAVYLSEPPSILGYAYTFLNNYFLLLTIAAFGFLCSVLLKGQRMALSVSAATVLLNFIFYKGLEAVGVDERITRFSPFYYADPTRFLVTGEANWPGNLVLLAAAAVMLVAALVLFRRKDVLA